MCIVYWLKLSGRRPRKYRRIDSLRRYLIGLHFNHMAEGDALHCCKIEDGFTDAFLSSLDHTVDSNSSFSGSREGDAD